MAKFADITDRQPHVIVDASDAVHQIPHSLLRDVIAGRQPSSILTEPVLQRIVEEWMATVCS
ncbi:hypothetical protein CXB48_13925 [Stutzerimonas stutzeri]|nr:hypothetical protein CXB48_13925 [Stutzerimonas stutzeri]